MVGAALVDLRVRAREIAEPTTADAEVLGVHIAYRAKSAAWGAGLGLLFATRVCSQSAWLLPIYALVSGNFWTSTLVMALYGTARSASVVSAVVVMEPHFGSPTLALLSSRRMLSAGAGVVVLMFGLALLATAAASYTRDWLN